VGEVTLWFCGCTENDNGLSKCPWVMKMVNSFIKSLPFTDLNTGPESVSFQEKLGYTTALKP